MNNLFVFDGVQRGNRNSIQVPIPDITKILCGLYIQYIIQILPREKFEMIKIFSHRAEISTFL